MDDFSANSDLESNSSKLKFPWIFWFNVNSVIWKLYFQNGENWKTKRPEQKVENVVNSLYKNCTNLSYIYMLTCGKSIWGWNHPLWIRRNSCFCLALAKWRRRLGATGQYSRSLHIGSLIMWVPRGSVLDNWKHSHEAQTLVVRVERNLMNLQAHFSIPS